MNVKPISPTYPIRQMKSKKEKTFGGKCTNRNLHLVEMALKAARPYGLEAEVMWSALTFAAEANEHGQTMENVLDAALGEWDVKDKDYYLDKYADPDHPLNKHDEGQMYNMNEQDVNENSAGGGAHGHFSNTWYSKDESFKNRTDTGKRHRKLKIDEDGTVNELI